MKLTFATGELSVVSPNPDIPMANGMRKSADGKKIIVLSQGFNRTGAGVFELDPETLESTPIVNTYYGRNFNSLNDIETTEDGKVLFFTDPPYGFEQGFRVGQPELGSNVYRYDTTTKTVTILSTGFQRPNGITLFDDRASGLGCTLYVSDSGFEGTAGVQLPRGFLGFGDSAVYSIVEPGGSGCFEPAYPAEPLGVTPIIPVTAGIQDGMQVHKATKLLLFCSGEGLWIMDILSATQIGLVNQPCTQVIFSQEVGVQKVYILSERQLFTIDLNFDPFLRGTEAMGGNNGKGYGVGQDPKACSELKDKKARKECMKNPVVTLKEMDTNDDPWKMRKNSANAQAGGIIIWYVGSLLLAGVLAVVQ